MRPHPVLSKGCGGASYKVLRRLGVCRTAEYYILIVCITITRGSWKGPLWRYVYTTSVPSTLLRRLRSGLLFWRVFRNPYRGTPQPQLCSLPEPEEETRIFFPLRAGETI